jgi:DNA-binding LacI/PurR family transcriptional regulator
MFSMRKRTYKKYTEVYASLEEHCNKACRLEVSRILPGERELASELHTSRMTLRKALEKAEMNGLICRKNKLTEVISQESSLRNCGKILFISTGYRTEFTLGAFQRLWIGLKTQLESMGADLELLLTNNSTTKDEIQERCEQADIILLTVLQYNDPPVDIDFLVAMKSKKTIISLSDPSLELFDNYIALDNYAAGELAAKALHAAGCCRPVFIAGGYSNTMFYKRFYGFCDTMKHVGIKVPENFPKTDSRHFHEICRKELLNAVQNGCDGAFLASDEGIDFITHDLFNQNLIPEKFKLITLNGQGEALLCHHPITCVNHATQEVTNVLLDHLKKISKNLKPTPIKRLITPDLYLNKTIGKININLTEELIWQY